MTVSRNKAPRKNLQTTTWRAKPSVQALVYSLVVVHHLMVVFVLFGWLIPAREVLLLHAALVPVIVIHWRFNHDRCILTNLENWLRHEDESRPHVADQEPFIGQLLSHIYRRNVSFATTQAWAHSLAIIPWILGLFRLKELS